MTSSDRSQTSQVTWTNGDGSLQTQPASIVALDQKTVTVEVDHDIPLEGECTVALLDRDGERVLTAQATTHFVRSRQANKHVSCRWLAPLGQAQLDLLAGCGLYDRRAGQRKATAIDVPAWPELSEAAGVVPISVVDLSTNGCCVKSPLAVPVGHRLLIHAWGEQAPVEAVRMRVQWQQPSGDEFLLGCAFTQKAGHSTLASLAEPDDSDNGSIAQGGGLVRRVLALGQAGMSLVSDAVGVRSRV